MSTHTYRIEVGQRWRSKDPRDHGRIVTVESIDPGVNQPGNNGFVVVRSVRRSTMRARTLHTRYEPLPAPLPAADETGGA